MKSAYETWETRRFNAVKKKQATTDARVDEAVTKAQSALDEAQQALAIVDDPNGPVQQAIGDSATALSKAQDAVSQVGTALDAANQAAADAAEAQTTADGKNTVYAQPDEPTGGTYTQGDVWFNEDPAGDVEGVLVWNGTEWVDRALIADSVLVPSSVGTVSIAGGAVTAPKIEAHSITGEQIQAESLTSQEIAARSIVASRLILGDNTNLIPDPTFQAPLGGSWTTGGAWEVKNFGTPGVRGVALGDFTGGLTVTSERFAVLEGDNLLGRMHAYNDADAAVTLVLQFFDSSGGYIETLWTARKNANDATWTSEQGALTVPKNAMTAHARITVNGATTASTYTRVGGVQVLRRSNGELIVDGAITADKIAAGEVTTPKLAAGSITTAKMTIGDPSNLVDDPDFMTGIGNPGSAWVHVSGNGTTHLRNDPNRNWRMLQFAADGSGVMRVDNQVGVGGAGFSVTPGEELYFECRVWSTGNAPSRRVRLRYADGGGQYKGFSGYLSTTYNNWRTLSGVFTVPAGAYKARVSFELRADDATARANFYLPTLYRRASGSLIVNGAITADKIDANAIDGKTITGATIYGRNPNGNGSYVHISQDQIYFYDSGSSFPSVAISPDGIFLGGTAGAGARVRASMAGSTTVSNVPDGGTKVATITTPTINSPIVTLTSEAYGSEDVQYIRNSGTQTPGFRVRVRAPSNISGYGARINWIAT